MKEDLLQFIWKYKLFSIINLRSTQNENIEIIHSGTHNKNAGPDFFNARIRIGDTVWAGNIEIHLRSSDWYKHKHLNNKAYESIILHVVLTDDQPITDSYGTLIPTVELAERIEDQLLNKYKALLKAENLLPCQSLLSSVDSFVIDNWLDRLVAERLEEKVVVLEDEFQQTTSNWEETFYRIIAKSFGFSVNAQPFLLLARSLPAIILAKHHNNLLQLEALLFGQAGMLNETFEDDYPRQLQKEYQFLAAKYKLIAIESHTWKFLRLRPSNFPSVRIAQFAHLVFKSHHLLAKVLEIGDIQSFSKLFIVHASAYWNDHYLFDKSTKDTEVKFLGKESINSILINVVVPFIFFYGKKNDNEKMISKALTLLEHISGEQNATTKLFSVFGVKSETAAHSQALIQLKNSYCDSKYCLNCGIGVNILKKCYNE